MNIAVLGMRIPTPDMDAGSLRMIRLLKLLHESGNHVSFVACHPLHNDLYGKRLAADTLVLQASGIEVLPSPQYLREKLLETADQPDMVILSDEWIAHRYLETLRSVCPNALVVFDTVDLHHIRLYREAKITRNRKMAILATHVRAQELNAVANSDVTLVVSHEEARILALTHPDADVQVLSNIHPVPDRTTPPFDTRTGLLFTGSFNHSPNVDAIQILMDILLPDIFNHLPGISVTIVGDSPPEPWASHPPERVRFTGFVPDLVPFYDQARLFVAPLRFGAGVKGKVLDSMAHGLPVVATRIAAEGIGATDSVHMAIGKTNTDFVQKLASLYTDKNTWVCMQNNGRSLVTENFSWEQARIVVQYLLKRSARQ